VPYQYQRVCPREAVTSLDQQLAQRVLWERIQVGQWFIKVKRQFPIDFRAGVHRRASGVSHEEFSGGRLATLLEADEGRPCWECIGHWRMFRS